MTTKSGRCAREEDVCGRGTRDWEMPRVGERRRRRSGGEYEVWEVEIGFPAKWMCAFSGAGALRCLRCCYLFGGLR